MFHVTGEPMLLPKPLEALSRDLRRLHDHLLSTEKSLLASKDPGYPTYAARVPEGKCTSTHGLQRCYSCGLTISLRYF